MQHKPWPESNKNVVNNTCVDGKEPSSDPIGLTFTLINLSVFILKFIPIPLYWI